MEGRAERSRLALAGFLGGHVDPAEDQRLLAEVQLLDACEARAHDDVPLLARLKSATATLVEHLGHAGGHVGPELFQTVVGALDVRLFDRQIRMGRHLDLAAASGSPGKAARSHRTRASSIGDRLE